MREVEVSRFVPAAPAELDRLLTPQRVIEYEGSFSADDGSTTDAGTIVTASGPGLTLQYRFVEQPDGWYYEQAGGAGPFESMETWLTIAAKNEGSQVGIRSQVSLSIPLPFADRLAGWKRRGELQRALDAIAAEL